MSVGPLSGIGDLRNAYDGSVIQVKVELFPSYAVSSLLSFSVVFEREREGARRVSGLETKRREFI